MPGLHGGALDVLGLCAYCEVPTHDACSLCGASMCAAHAAEGVSLCVGCAQRRVDD